MWNNLNRNKTQLNFIFIITVSSVKIPFKSLSIQTREKKSIQTVASIHFIGYFLVFIWNKKSMKKQRINFNGFFCPMIGMAHNIAPKLRLLNSFIHSKDICWVFFFVWHFRKFRFEHISYLLETKETFFYRPLFWNNANYRLVSGLGKTTPITKSKQRTHKLSINWTFFLTILFYGDAFLSSCVQKITKQQNTALFSEIKIKEEAEEKIPLVFIRQFIALRNDA